MEALNVVTPGAGHATARFAVVGMSCGGCAAKVQRVVSALPGVSQVTVDLAARTATVAHDPSLASVEAIVGAISALDYEVRALS